MAVIAAVSFAAVQVTAAGAAEPPFPYPSPAFDFSHPASPHSAAFSTVSGTRTIPLLVVYGTFTDAAEVPGVSAATIAQTIFPIGTAQTIADYFSSVSGGRLRFVPAAESQGTTNDGVVQASLGANAVFEGLFTSGGFAAQGLAVAQAADPFVNYASFDSNGDGSVTTNELAILSIKTSVGGANCGVTAGIGAGTLDGKSLASNGWSDTVTLTNEMTIAHELAHLVLGTKDNSYTPGAFDILGPTCGGPAADLWLPNSFNSMHWGWVTPTVVTRDGYYNVNPGSPYLLYDPARGTNDYFLVENREATPYDTNRSDSGLAIWQVLDSNWGTARGAFELVRPGSLAFPPNNYGGSSFDAWDPSDATTPQRTMTSPWADNSAAKVAVRAIGNAGTTVRAYFDVRGPGVLVDTYALANSAPAAFPLGAASSVSFPVMNTGEQTETFGFTMSSLPPGWTASTDTKTLAAGTASTATVQITPPLTTAVGPYNLTAVGTNTADPSVTTTSGFTVKVVRRTTAITYTGDLTADYHDTAQLKATLIDSLSGAPLAAKLVQFGLGAQATSAISDGAGLASATIIPDQVPSVVSLTASFDGDTTYLPSSDVELFTITREQTTTTYTGPTVILQGASGVTLAARLLEDGTTAPVPAGQSVQLSLGGQSCVATVDTNGNASCTLTFTGPLGPEPLAAVFTGDSYYLPSSDTSKAAVVFAMPARGAFVVGDTTAATAAPSTTLTWWGSQWSSRNAISGGAAPSAFKGFADSATNVPSSTPVGLCGGTWTTTPGNSSDPVAAVPSYMGVLVTSRSVKSGSTISGTYTQIVVVRTGAGYDANPGHPGTGTVVATFCP